MQTRAALYSARKEKGWIQTMTSKEMVTTLLGEAEAIFQDRTPEAAARQCAMMFAQAAEWHLEILRATEGKPIPLYIKNPLREHVASLVYHCRDLKVAPRGLGGVHLPLLRYALETPGFYGEQI